MVSLNKVTCKQFTSEVKVLFSECTSKCPFSDSSDESPASTGICFCKYEACLSLKSKLNQNTNCQLSISGLSEIKRLKLKCKIPTATVLTPSKSASPSTPIPPIPSQSATPSTSSQSTAPPALRRTGDPSISAPNILDPTATGNPNGGAQLDSQQSHHSTGNGSVGQIAGVIGLVMLFVIGLLLLFAYIKRRRRRKRDSQFAWRDGDKYNELKSTKLGSLSDSPMNHRDILIDVSNDNQIAENEVKYSRHIGTGASSDVWLGEYRKVNVAIKLLKSKPGEVEQDQIQFIKEIELITKLRHDNIVCCLGLIQTSKGRIGAVLEYADIGDLKTALYTHKNNQKFTWKEYKNSIAIDILEGLVYLHSQNIIHRDLKSANVVLTKDMKAKVSDFGLSREILLSQSQEFILTGCVGTPLWMAPEVLMGKHRYTNLIDLYSFGVVLIELDTMDIPFSNCGIPMHQIPYEIANNEFKPHPSESCPPAIKRIIDICLQTDPSKRLSAERILHQWKAFVIPELKKL